MIGWSVFYIVWKWTTNAPIIVGKRRKRSNIKITSIEANSKEIEEMIELAYHDIIKKLDEEIKRVQFEDGKASITKE